MAYSNQIREEELKNKVAADFFPSYDTTRILGDVDFCVAIPKENNTGDTQYFLWAEAKKGNQSVLEESIAQLILTIGKARTFETHLPPSFIGAFDTSKICFVPYNSIHEIFYITDFNWNVTPSDYSTKEFKTVLDFVKKSLAENMLSFEFDKDRKELVKFINTNFKLGKKRISRVKISKNNFVVIYQKWLKKVKPTIEVDWEAAKKEGVFDSDFYLADLLSKENESILDTLQVVLKNTYYVLGRKKTNLGFFSSQIIFGDSQKAYKTFWNKYERPPKKEYWNYIIDRKDLLVPQDIRERQGSYFTPQKWVELSQDYIANELGEDWQEEYYIWDCAAGTGNLLNGLSNKYHIWASTLNQGDVDIIKTRIENGANLLPDHVFQFDFLNDSFEKLPQRLREIIENEETRKKLVIYINPPYGEAANKHTVSDTGENKKDIAVKTYVYSEFKKEMGIAGRELFAQFLMRINKSIPGAIIANFSTLKNLQAPNFRLFRRNFHADLKNIFIVPADTFDNVTGKFPIGFHIWSFNAKAHPFSEILADVYDSQAKPIGRKLLASIDNKETINDWIIKTRNRPNEKKIGFMSAKGADFQNVNSLFIINSKSQLPHPRGTVVTSHNLIEISIYFSVRKVVNATWLNDRDQFSVPNDCWKKDYEFQNDSLAFTLFSNNVSGKAMDNHWIPFTENEVGARDCFKSHFMTQYFSGKARPPKEADIFSETIEDNKPLVFSEEATAVFDAGRELWRYYHSRPDSNPDASLYDIKMYFQGTKILKNGKVQMHTKSEDDKYMSLIKTLREKLKILAAKIEPKVYEYGFLKK